jgi:hypothetical protein
MLARTRNGFDPRTRRTREDLGLHRRRVEVPEVPKDYVTFIRYHADLKEIPARFPMPEPLTLDQLDSFLERFGDRYPARWP